MLDKDIKKDLIKLICTLNEERRESYLDEMIEHNDKLCLGTINDLLEEVSCRPSVDCEFHRWLKAKQIERAIEDGWNSGDENIYNAGRLYRKLDEMVGRMDTELEQNEEAFDISVSIDGHKFKFYWSAPVVNALQSACREIISEY